ncbi:helix-turn-helix transcriptional regulator [Thalassorhabdomicrobium marinisediminis]|uniref:HTH luxR-type domain-containing protein n=1 Tax=Thalassorhabdomicrobium marinisediminis TaxID=2170577 RepID=A0A2T7FU91_9RHOB|nr:helix-turn-helix transcriptional regulator [Thalassorhabdomicrobium marinisediminis]PVA05729.1 hypothetical protein DC363_12940 [Thalassorhabdomicrobium marinisediminis]
MLDFTSTAAGPEPALIDWIYKTIVDEGDLPAAIERLRADLGLNSLQLSQMERGDETVLCCAGTPLTAAVARDAHSLDGPINENGRRLVLQYTGTTDQTENAAVLSQVLSHIDRAVTLAARIDSSEVMRKMGSDLLGRLCIGTIFLDAKGQMVSATGSASSMLAASDGLRLRGGAVAATCAFSDRALQSAIRTALAHPDGGNSELLRLNQSEADRALGLVVQPVPRTARKGAIACALVIRDSDRPSAPGLDLLRGLFDLTPAEAGLTRILAMGHTLDEAAADLSISRNTARAHLRAIFSKCGINRQTELVRLVLSSVAMLQDDMPRAA